MPPRVGVLGLFHETNTFSPVHTGRTEFGRRWYRGEALRAAFAGTDTVIGGFLRGADAAELEMVPVFGAFATPSGLVTEDVAAEVRAEIESGLASLGPFDAIFIELHGALVCESGNGVGDVEEEVVDLVRAKVGDIPIAAVLDFHANLGRPRLTGVDVLLGYRTNPHIDTGGQGERAARILGDVLKSGSRPVRVHRGIPIIAPPVRQGTAAHPMDLIMARAAEIEASEGFLDVTIHAGYSYADVPHLGMGVSVTVRAEDRERAERAATELAGFIWDAREGFRCDLPDGPAALARAIEVSRAGGPVVVIDTGDNINGGTPGDATWLLDLALRMPDTSVLGVICDPAVAARAHAAGEGAVIDVVLGGHTDPSVGPPIRTSALVVRIADGTFRNTGPMSTGAAVSMGAAAVLRIGSCDVVVEQYPVQPNDPELFRCMGLEPTGYSIVLLKGAAAVRAGWAPLARQFIEAGTPGLTDSRLDRREYLRSPRPMWPLDAVEPTA